MRHPLTPAELGAVLAHALGGAAVGAVTRELTEGTFNAAHAVDLLDGRQLVVKVAPPPGTPLLTHERHLLRTEAMCLRMVAERTDVPVPELVSAGTDPLGREHLVTSLLPGASWSSQAARLDDATRRVLRRQVGRHVAELHTVTGEGSFGYPGRPELCAPTWRGAFGRIVDAVLDDATRYGVVLPLPAEEVRARVHAAADVALRAVTTPVLVHADLWDGNVFVDLDRPDPQVSGFIDHERALWGDPAADLVSLALLADVADDADLLAGYAEAGGPVVLDEATRYRLHLYRAHLALVMVVEAVPRGTAGPEHAGWNDRVARWLAGELAALERT
ncbi:aminoglycoside phosphotransferase family protein [Modestobacter sp. L9-4]|uniref:phosphotransferase family protein n=1 Tax=Modestobacter sp. L9-4 TaxID=2851567 RepID=UPI001C756627|nr:aminoglycoside phosphotransferase family protein [Modestobacter sp. L9-4]QXG75483.1 aminoglycoside phosphotransferase family protein [Modestobacter sp. L9-4]